MIQDINSLYQSGFLNYLEKTIFSSQDTPQHASITVRNPMCGDELSFWYQDIASSFEKNIFWSGQGCLICRASAEAICQIMNEISENKHHICNQILEFFVEPHNRADLLPYKFQAFREVKQMKSRINCVTLALKGVQKLQQGQSKDNE